MITEDTLNINGKQNSQIKAKRLFKYITIRKNKAAWKNQMELRHAVKVKVSC